MRKHLWKMCVCSLHRTYQTLCISILNVFWLMQVTLLPCSNGRGPMVPEGLPWTSAALVLFHCEEIGHCRRLSSYEKAARKSCSRHWRRCIFSDLVLPVDIWIYFSRYIGRGLSVSLIVSLWGIAPLLTHNHHVSAMYSVKQRRCRLEPRLIRMENVIGSRSCELSSVSVQVSVRTLMHFDLD